MEEKERKEGRGRLADTRMPNVSSRVHFTPLKKMGSAGIIIALKQHGVKDEGSVRDGVS